MHVYHTPWGKYCFLVGIAEVREYLRYLTDALVNMHKVSLTGEGTIFLSCLFKASGIETLAYLVEVFLRYTLGHELRPRFVLNLSGEVINSEVVLRVARIGSAIHQQRYAQGNATDVGHAGFELLTSLLQLLVAGKSFSLFPQPFLTLLLSPFLPLLLKLLVLLCLLLRTFGSLSFLAADALLIFGSLFLTHVAEVDDLLGILAFLVGSLTAVLAYVVDNVLVYLIELVLVVETRIIEALAHQTVDEHILKLLVDGIDVHRTHLASLHRQHRAQLYKVAHCLLVAHLLCLLFLAFRFLLLLCLCH